MTTVTLNIPMTARTKSAIEDCFIDGISVQRFLREGLLTRLGIEGKNVIEQEQVSFQETQDNGKAEPKPYSLKDVNLADHMMPSNPSYLIDGLAATDNHPLTIALGERLYDRLETYTQIIHLRHELFGKSFDAFLDNQLIKYPKENPDNKKGLEDITEQVKKQKEMRLKSVPTSFEQALYPMVFAELQKKLDERESGIITKENEEIAKLEEAALNTPPPTA